MHRLSFVIFIFISYTGLTGQGTLPCFTVVANVDESAPSQIDLHVYPGENEFWLDETQYVVESHGKYFFEEKKKLHSFFRCAYDFSAFGQLGMHRADKFVTEDGLIFYMAFSNTSELSYLILDGYLYLVYPCDDSFTCFHPFHYPPKFSETRDTIELAPARIELASAQADFDTLYEQVLVHDASIVYSIIPAEFEIVTEQILIGDSLSCQGYPEQYDTIYEQLLVKETYTTLDTVDNVFETVTEQVLAVWEHVGIDTMRVETKDSLVAIEVRKRYLGWEITDTLSACVSENPFDCVTLELIEQDPDSIITNIEIVQGDCPVDYSLLGSYCLSEVFNPHTYEFRQYEKLVTPSIVVETPVPAEYTTVEKVILSDANAIPDSCIDRKYQTVEKLILDIPAYAESIEVPAEYTTRFFLRPIGTISIDSVELERDELIYSSYTMEEAAKIQYGPFRCEEFVSEDYKQMILNKLIEENYLESLVEFNSVKFWRAFLQYQLDRDLPTGKIDTMTLEEMGIE